METDFAAMHADLDDALKAKAAAQERADRLQLEVNRLTDELRHEQEGFKNAEAARKQLEVEIREITVRLEEAEAFAQREGKRLVAKLQARVSQTPLSPPPKFYHRPLEMRHQRTVESGYFYEQPQNNQLHNS